MALAPLQLLAKPTPTCNSQATAQPKRTRKHAACPPAAALKRPCDKSHPCAPNPFQRRLPAPQLRCLPHTCPPVQRRQPHSRTARRSTLLPKAHTICYTDTAVRATTDKPQLVSRAAVTAAAAASPPCCSVLLPPLALLLLLLSVSAFSTHASISGFTTSGASSCGQ